MSDKPAEKKPEAAAGHGDKKEGDGHGDAKKAGGIGALLGKTPVMLGGVMVIEAVVLFAGFKMFGGKPKAAAGAEIAITSAADEKGESGAKEGDAKSEGAKEESHGGGEHEAAPAEHGGGEGSEHGGGGEHGGATADAPKPMSAADKKRPCEVEILNFRAPNKLSGRTFLYDVNIFAVTKGVNEKRVKEVIESRKALITDRVRTIIAQTDPEKLGGGSEPGLETFRRQVKYQLDQILGDGIVDEVLVPRCIPFRTDY